MEIEIFFVFFVLLCILSALIPESLGHELHEEDSLTISIFAIFSCGIYLRLQSIISKLMRLILGFFLGGIAFLGCTYFRNYSGSIIPYPILWYFSFIVLGFVGAWLVYTSFLKAGKRIDKEVNQETEAFKASSEKIQLDFDLCEFKNGSYYQEIVDERVNMVNRISPFTTTSPSAIIVRKESSTLVYNYSNTERYLGSFPVDPVTLKSYVLTGKVALYVSRFDKSKYHFELES